MIKKLLKKIATILPFFMKKRLESFKLFIKNPALFINTNNKLEFYNKKIIIISFPRSGSSWVGSILGAGDETLYLREPVTTPYLLEKRGRISVFDPEITKGHDQYYSYIDSALNGNSPKLSSIYPYPKQWNESDKNKTLIIKEVNPFVIQRFNKTENQIIYLLRHPYSIAKSYKALQWKKNDLFTRKFQTSELKLIQTFSPTILTENFWFQMGYLLGWIEAKSKLSLNPQAIIIRYEDLCKAPQASFKQLFKQIQIAYDRQVQNTLTQSFSTNLNTAVGEFSLQRNIESIAYVKVNKADEADYIELMTAYSQAIADHIKHYNTTVTSAYQVNCSLIKWID